MIMVLSKENFKVYAAHYYDNPFCLTEDEFESDLFKSSVIKRLINNHAVKGSANLKLLVNTTISFYNVFNHNAATSIIKFKIPELHYRYINSILVFLNFPTIPGFVYDENLYMEIKSCYS